MNVHFYWHEPVNPKKGEGWQFLNRLTIASHVKCGHKPIIWVDGDAPTSKYWIDDIDEVDIRNAQEILKTSEFYTKEGSNPRTASTLFSYEIVYRTGEYYADTDAIAIKPWPEMPLVLAGSEPEHISVGVIRMPAGHQALKCAMTNIDPVWGNVKVFTKCCREMGLDNNVPTRWFYPIHWKNQNWSRTFKCKGKFLDRCVLPSDCYSYHYYSNKVSLVGIDHTWMKDERIKGSLFHEMCRLFFREGIKTINKKWTTK